MSNLREMAVVGCLLAEPSLKNRMDIAPQDFTDPEARALVEAALHTDGDVVAILKAAGEEYRQYATEAALLQTSTANFDGYLDELKEEIRLRRAFEIVCEMQSAVVNGDANEMRRLYDRIGDSLRDESTTDEYSARDMMARFIEDQSKEPDYIKTGFKELDRETYLSPGDYIIIGGRPSSGKTAFALNLAAHMAKTRNVVFFSLETSALKLMERMVACIAGVSFSAIKQRNILNGQAKQKILDGYDAITGLKLTFVDTSGYTVQKIQAKAQKLRADIVFIDYLGLIQADGTSRYEKVTNISVDLHTFAQRTKTAVFALAQLNRGAAGHEDPSMHELRESGQIEQDADVVLLMNNRTMQPDNYSFDVIVAKNKDGITGKLPFLFYGGTQKFIAEDLR